MAVAQPDLLAGAAWECAPTAPGEVADPDGLDTLRGRWLPARVPGTAAGALRASGRWDEWDERDFDAEDWWFRCRIEQSALPEGARSAEQLVLRADGLATVCEVFLSGSRVLTSESMFAAHRVEVPAAALCWPLEVTLVARALRPLLAQPRPRPRWHSLLVAEQGLRFHRTTLLGRTTGLADAPAPVGPWRPLTLRPPQALELVTSELDVRCTGQGGRVAVRARFRAAARRDGDEPALRLGATSASLLLREGPDGLEAEGEVQLDEVERWWPHTHGRQPLYDVSLELFGQHVGLGRVGFRTVEADEADGGFALAVNGVPVFVRGACWSPADPVSLAPTPGATAARVRLARQAGMNMLRLTGATFYEGREFHDACDEMGVLVWQDVMLAALDPPTDAAFEDTVAGEAAAALRELQGRPSVAVVCGSSEVEQQAAMLGLPREKRELPLLTKRLRDVAASALPGVPYVPSSPTGGDPPFRADTGVAHYFGVGAYLRPPHDARRASVRFASECLAFATPPSADVVDDVFGSAGGAGHDPRWKLGVPRNRGCSWDFEDVRDHYVATLFGLDAAAVRREDPERALDLGRAAVAALVESTIAEWRRPGSRCAGALVLSLADLRAGAGFGLLDRDGRPKAPYHAFARAAAPVAVLVTDEGLNGLHAHCCNDGADALEATVVVELFADGERLVARGERPLTLAPHESVTVGADEVLGEFWDVTYAYRFGRPAHDVAVVLLRDVAGGLRSRAVHFPLGLGRPVEPDVGLVAECRAASEGSALVARVGTRRLAQFVRVEVPGYLPSESWFHLPPGATHEVRLARADCDAPGTTGKVSALNSRRSATLRLEGSRD